jgi:16S rRNA processing protein RimM
VGNEELILLGKIIKIHGYQGAVMIGLENKFSKEIEELESLFVEVDGKMVPFFISWFEYTGKDVIKMKFDDFDSREKVLEFSGCRVFVPFETIETDNSSDLPVELAGYTLVDKDGKILGLINKVVSYPRQVMLVINDESGSEILIPYALEWVMEMDDDKKRLRMDLPGGIADINR